VAAWILKRIRSIKSKVHKNEKNLNRVNHKIRDLYLKDIDGKYDDKEIVKGIQADLLFAKDQIQKELNRDKQQLESMPSIKRTEWEAKLIRYGLMDYFGSQKHLNEMLYSDKRELLHWMFNGADGNGDRFGIYVEKQGKMWHYIINARMMLGTRTIFKNNIDYDGWDEDYKLEFYKTKRLCPK
jgi:hypothetical protein